MAKATYYNATLCLHAPISVTKSEQQGRVEVTVSLDDSRVRVNVKKKLAVFLAQKPPEGEQGLILWPRTDREGRLGSGTQLALYKSVDELGREPGLHALGELVKVDKENALLQILIYPNKGQGSLHKPFRLPLVATLELLEGLPELGSGVEVWGELKPKSWRLLATCARTVILPSKRAITEVVSTSPN